MYNKLSSFPSFQNKIFPLLMISQFGKQIIIMDKLPNISRSKGNQTMKFGPFIEYNVRHIFLEKSYTECDAGIGLRTSKKSKLSISQGNQSEQSVCLFFECPSRELPKYTET